MQAYIAICDPVGFNTKQLTLLLPVYHQFQGNIPHIYEMTQSSHGLLYKRLLQLHHHDEYQYPHTEHVGGIWNRIVLQNFYSVYM